MYNANTNYHIQFTPCKQDMPGKGTHRCLEPAFPPLLALHQPNMPELLIKRIRKTIHTYVQRDPTWRRLSSLPLVKTQALPDILPQVLIRPIASTTKTCNRSMAKSMPPHISMGTKVRQLGSFATACSMQIPIIAFNSQTARKACLEGESAAA